MAEQKTLGVIVVGPVNSGKTQFCNSLFDTYPQTCMIFEGINWVEYWDFEINSKYKFQLFTSTGHIDEIWEYFGGEFFGFILILDSTRPETFRECQSICEAFRAYAPVPYVIAANKQDLEGAWTIEALRRILRLSSKTPIISCNATHKKSVGTVLMALCEEVLREMEEAET